MYISASRHEIHDISDRTYFQKPEEIIHGLREVVQILSSWKSDKLLLSFHLSFSVDFRRSSGQKSRKILSIGRPFTSWRLRTARNARDSDWKVLWVFLCRICRPHYKRLRAPQAQAEPLESIGPISQLRDLFDIYEVSMLCFSPTQPLLFVSLRRRALRDQTIKRTAV